MKPIIVSPHAFERIHERQITRHHVELSIRAPDLKGAAKHGRLKAVRKFDNQTLHVFYRETPKALIFITAYWSNQ